MFSLVYTVYCQKMPPEYRCSVRKGTLKNFVKFIGKHLCWSHILIKLQVWQLFWRTSANDCFYTALAPLAVAYPFYSPSSSSSVLSKYHRCLFFVQTHNVSKNLNLVSHFHWVTSGSALSSVSFFSHVFSVFLSFILFSCRCS